MSITDELREYAHDCCARVDDAIHAIADRIDMEHERRMEERADRYCELRTTMKERYIELPKDADGVPIHIGDVLTDDAEFKSEGNVECLMFDESGWMVGFGKGWTDVRIHEWHHYHAPTVEDLIRDAILSCIGHSPEYWDEPIAECAAKLRLAGDAE